MSRFPRSVGRALLPAAFLALLLAACARVAVLPPLRLAFRLSPPSPARLLPGSRVRVSVRVEPPTQMLWVSGTVGILGAPVVAFRRSKDGGSWIFRTMVPPFLSVPSGTYRVKAWGMARDGRKVRGETTYEVE